MPNYLGELLFQGLNNINQLIPVMKQCCVSLATGNEPVSYRLSVILYFVMLVFPDI
jgi:hypothetical protein